MHLQFKDEANLTGFDIHSDDSCHNCFKGCWQEYEARDPPLTNEQGE